MKLKLQLPFILALFVVSLVTYIIYTPGLSGPFLLDDTYNLSAMNKWGGITSLDSALEFIFTNNSGSLGRPISMASFLISDQHWSGNEYSFKYFNLLLHIATGLLVFYFVFLICINSAKTERSSYCYGIIVASLWLLHPFNVSTVLYVIQRMTQLSCFFILFGLILFCKSFSFDSNERRYSFFFASMFSILLATFSKENGVLGLLYIALIYFFLCPRSRRNDYRILIILFVYLPIVLLTLYLLSNYKDFERAYDIRNFSAFERLLTEFRILWIYIAKILGFSAHETGLFHDDIEISTSFLDPMQTFFAFSGLFLIIFYAFLVRHLYRIQAIAILLFFSSHLLESTLIPLELYFEHRNYFATIAVLLFTVSFLDMLLGFIRSVALKTVLCILIFVVVLGVVVLNTSQSVRIWSSTFHLLTYWATEHPESNRAQRVYGQFLGKMPFWRLEGLRILDKGEKKFPEDPSIPLSIVNINCSNGMPLKYSGEQLKEKFNGRYRVNAAILTEIRNFGDLFYYGDCNSYYSIQVIHALFNSFKKIEGLNGSRMAELLFYHAEIYANEGDLNRAILKLEEAKIHDNSIAIPFRQAQYLGSAGLYEESLKYVKQAEKAKGIGYMANSKDLRLVRQLKSFLLEKIGKK